MANRRRRTGQSLARKTAELAFATPQVMAHRLTRMALSGYPLSDRDRKEFTRMIAEKHAAFQESWTAMFMQTALANQALAASFFRSFLTMPPGKRLSVAKSAAQIHRATLGVLNKGLSPVHRKAVANAKRLTYTKLR